MSIYRQAYPVIGCDLAVPLHEQLYGQAPIPLEYVCYELPFYPGRPSSGSVVYATPMGTPYRLTVHYLYPGDDSGAITTHDWNWNGANPPLEADFNGRTALFDTFLGAVASEIQNQASADRYTWHELKADGTGPITGVVHEETPQVTFVGSPNVPTQVACSVTEITSVRRRWGRFYLPYITADDINVGRLGSLQVDAIADAAAGFMTLSDPNWVPIVYGLPDPHVLPVTAVRVDNVLDVIRSRRFNQATHKKTTVLT